MRTLLLDTSVIFDHLNGRAGRTELLARLLSQGNILACCPVNVTEVYAGLRPAEEGRTKGFIDSLEFFPHTPEIARYAGLLRRDWRQRGQTLSYTDVTIAAVALVNRLPLLTDNRQHFPMPDLELLDLPSF